MPLYTYQCLSCEKEQDEFKTVEDRELCPSCKNCASPTKKLISRLGSVNFGWPKGGVTMENCEANPVHFETRSQAKTYAKKHNMELGCL